MSLQTIIEYLGTKSLFGGRRKEMDYSLNDALTDDADWDDQYWDFEKEKLSEVKEQIRKKYSDSSEGITFAALWAGDEPEHEIEESIEGLLQRFDECRIGTKDRYILTKKDNQSLLDNA
ncbi:MAG: hypothetical protein ACFB21_02875 [Opitutales bacterium]